MVDGQCMRVYQMKKTWVAASAYCRSVNGQLARNINTERNDWISGQSSKRILFGASDSTSEGQWIDSSGDEQVFFRWRIGEPNDGGLAIFNQDCVATWGTGTNQRGYWDDVECDDIRYQNYFVCELPCSSAPCGNHKSGKVSRIIDSIIDS